MKKIKNRAPPPTAHELTPHEFIRKSEAHLYFGYRPTQIDGKIKSGEIPPPIKLSKSGRATGWFGRQIIDWEAQKLAEAMKQD
jgi:predicted DNA-binding transcriptional regulator AlpA